MAVSLCVLGFLFSEWADHQSGIWNGARGMILIYIRKVEFDSKKYVEMKENRDLKEKKRTKYQRSWKRVKREQKNRTNWKSEVGELWKEIEDNSKVFTKIKTILEAIRRKHDEKRASDNL